MVNMELISRCDVLRVKSRRKEAIDAAVVGTRQVGLTVYRLMPLCTFLNVRGGGQQGTGELINMWSRAQAHSGA